MRNKITTKTIARIGNQSPQRTNPVVAVELRICARRMPGWNNPVRVSTCPCVSMNAETPETAASTTHLPVSTARIRLICRCWSDAAVKP